MPEKKSKKPKKATPKQIASAGGKARKEALPAERRIQIAKEAATARWGGKPLLATHRGNFREEFSIDVDCYVLDDEQKTAVISRRGMGATLGLGQTGGNKLLHFLEGQKVAPHVGPELRAKLANPLVFKWGSSAPNAPPPVVVHGYDVTILIDVCKVIIAANSGEKPNKRQEHIVKQAHVILNASAKSGIKNLAYALAKFDVTRDQVIAAFKFYVCEEAREYEKEFPDLLYSEWYRLYQLPKPERNKPWKFRELTIKHVYTPLAKSNGKVLTLTREKKAAHGTSHNKLHQFLSEVGVKALRTHLGRLLGMAETSDTRDEYEARVQKVFGVQLSFDFNGKSVPIPKA